MQPFCLGPLSPRLFTVSTTTGNLVSPIVVTTTAPHSFVNGDIVTISTVVGNTSANGTFSAQQVTPTTLALYNTSTGAGTTGNGSYVSGGQISAPTQLSLAKSDNLTSPKVSKLYFATVVGNAGTGTFVGVAGLNQATLASVIREMNKNSTGRIDFYNLDGPGDNVLTITDYWIDCLAPSTDFVLATYWRS